MKINKFILVLLSLLYLAGGHSLSKSLPLGSQPAEQAALVIGLFLLSLFIIEGLKHLDVLFQKTYYYLVILSLGMFFLSSPISDDVHRYLWEGIMVKEGLNPYTVSPLNSKDKLIQIPSADEKIEKANKKTSSHSQQVKKNIEQQYKNRQIIYEDINHKNKTAIYGPLFILLMSLLMLFSESFLIYKFCIPFLSLGLLFVALRLLEREKLPISSCGYFFLNPLFLIFVLGESHNEIFLLIPIGLFLYYYDRSKLSAWGIFLLGVAINIKLTAIFLLPLIIKKYYIRYWPLFLLPFLTYIIFLLEGYSTFESLLSFSKNFYFNNYLFKLMENYFGNEVRVFFLGLLLISVFLVNIYNLDYKRTAFFTMYLFLLFAPSVHPWYVLPLLFLNMFFVSSAVLIFSMSFLLLIPHYSLFLNSGQWHQPLWSEISIAVLIWLSLFYDLRKNGFKTQIPKIPPVTSQGISIIIPTLNEENNLKQCISSLIPLLPIDEIIIADAESQDKTVDIAKKLGIRVIKCAPGRGVQIKTALDISKNDFVCVIHADCRPYRDVLNRIRETLSQDPKVLMGAFSISYENENKLGFIQKLNDFRARFLGISFGDQIQFFRKEVLDVVGGYPLFPLMEDVELSMRMKKIGKIKFLDYGGEVSSRRWRKKGYLKNVFKVLLLFHEYLLVRFWKKNIDIRYFYNKYYGK